MGFLKVERKGVVLIGNWNLEWEGGIFFCFFFWVRRRKKNKGIAIF